MDSIEGDNISPEEEQAAEEFDKKKSPETGPELSSTPEKEPTPLEKNETQYILEHKTKAESSTRDAEVERNYPLESRYKDERTNAPYVLAEIGQFATDRGYKSEITPDMEKVVFSPETSSQLLPQAERQIEQLITDPEKHKAVSKEVASYLDLIQKAQEQHDISPSISMGEVAKMVETNISTLALQDQAASENMLGDHGIRHIVSHNIETTSKLFDELERNGQEVRAVDRLMAHQIMIDHDLGYAMAPVRESIYKEGLKGQDSGHNLLGAKFIRQRGSDPNDPVSHLFSEDQLTTMHEGILHHDDSHVHFHLNDPSIESRQENIQSAIHVADNSDAFEDKLPELIYSMPESLKSMRLLKTAGEIGDNEMIGKIKEQLKKQIEDHPDWSKDNKDTLTKVVDILTPDNYKFSVGRICGNNPEMSIGKNGVLEIKVQESAIHQEVIGLYGQKEYDQLKKFVADLTGTSKDLVNLDQDEIDTPDLIIKIAKGEVGKSQEKTDYESKIETLIHEPNFVVFASADRDFSARQKILEASLSTKNNPTEENKGTNQEEIDAIQGDIDIIKAKRRRLLDQYENGGV